MTKKEVLQSLGFRKSKKALNACGRNAGELSDAYKTASAEKWRAWFSCREKQEALNGSGLHVCGANTFAFSASFDFADDDGKKMIAYITPTASVYFAK